MRTAVRETSLEAFRGLGPKLPAQQSAIVDHLARNSHRDYTRSELAHALGISLQSVCGRVNELVKMRQVEECLRRRCERTGNTAYPVRIAKRQAGLFE